METKDKIKEIIVKLLKVRPEELKEDQPLVQCLGVDSTEMVEICIAITKQMGVEIEEKEISKTHSVSEIADILTSKQGV
jgi:acyl carrier protein